MATTRVRVDELELGQVISMPESGLEPAWIDGILHGPNFRNLRLVDLATGEPLAAISSLGSHRLVELHEVTAEVLFYTNITDEPVEQLVHNKWELVEPGETLHFVDVHDPDKWPRDTWSLRTEPFEVEQAM